MMRFLFKIRQLQSPLASILLVLIFLSAGFFHYIFYNMEIDYHNSKLKEADEMEANAIWDVVESTIVSSNYIAEHSAIHAANNITKDINAKYDVKTLKQQLDGSALEESEVVSLLYENIKENHLYKIDNNRNTLFILTNNGNIIRADNRYKPEKGKLSKSISDEVTETYNPDLAQNSLALLTKHDIGGLIFYEPEYIIDNPNHIKLSTPSLNGLKEVYYNEGLNGLTGYVILVPVYVTNDGDIFGTPDISPTGEINKNYKLIVVQQYSLIDAINFNGKTQIKAIKEHGEQVKKDILFAINLRTLSYTAILLLDIFALLIILYYSSFNIVRKK